MRSNFEKIPLLSAGNISIRIVTNRSYFWLRRHREHRDEFSLMRAENLNLIMQINIQVFFMSMGRKIINHLDT